MSPATQPIDTDVLTGFRLGDERSLERVFRDRYAALTTEAATELGDAGTATGPRVVERAFVRAWEARDRFDTPEALDAFLHATVHDGAVRERSRLAALHRFEAHEGVRHHARDAVAEPPVDEGWQHVSAMLHAPPPDAAVRHRALDESRHHAAEHLAASAKPRPIAVPLAIAAALAAVVFGGLWWVERNSEDTAVSAALSAPDSRLISSRVGQTGTTTLIDGSTVRLGADTRLTVAAAYGTAVRALKLEGAAAFQVAPREGQPFAVRVRDVTVRAVGTAFDIVAYPTDRNVLVRVREGGVTVSGESGEHTVSAGRAVAVAADGAVSDVAVDAATEAAGWADGRFVVRDKPLRDVLPLVVRWYGVELAVRDSALLGRAVTADVPLTSSREAIAAIEKSARLRFDYDGNAMVLRDSAGAR